MKKLFIVFLSMVFVSTCAIARDYTKIQKKEMGHAQKYGSTNRYFGNYNQNVEFANRKPTVKDPKIIKLGAAYTVINDYDYKAKLESDEEKYAEYEKQFKKVTWTNYNSQAQGRDYYRVYRVAERLIRANRLDYQPWRIAILRNTNEYNAYSTAGNLVALYTSAIDTLIDNDDALAILIGHELGHLLLGHSLRKAPDYARLNRVKTLAKAGNVLAPTCAAVLQRKMLIDSKNMEYAADIEGAKLAAKAGYDLNKCAQELSFMETLPHTRGDFYSDHPAPERRTESFNQNRRYFPIEVWKDMGKYNIYNTDVLKVAASSDRASIVISASESNNNPGVFYRPETTEEMYVRFGYTAYLNGEFKKSLENFEELFNNGTQNASAYLYASYAAEELYKLTKDEKYYTKAVNYVNQAKSFEPNNKYINEQLNFLNNKNSTPQKNREVDKYYEVEQSFL